MNHFADWRYTMCLLNVNFNQKVHPVTKHSMTEWTWYMTGGGGGGGGGGVHLCETMGKTRLNW